MKPKRTKKGTPQCRENTSIIAWDPGRVGTYFPLTHCPGPHGTSGLLLRLLLPWLVGRHQYSFQFMTTTPIEVGCTGFGVGHVWVQVQVPPLSGHMVTYE